MDLSIIIVNYNTSDLIKYCVESIFKYTQESLTFEIIVVDNASKKEEVEKLQHLDKIQLIEAGGNLGFGRGNNVGVQHAQGEFVLLLNSDTLFIEDSLDILMKTFKEYEEELNIGALGCELVDRNLIPNGSYYNFSDCKKIIHSNLNFVLSKLKSSPSQKVEVQKSFDRKGFLEVDYIIGADIMMRRKLYNRIGGFDKDYFMYFEEADLQLKIKNLGLNRYITNRTKIIHFGGGSTGSSTKLSNQRRILIQKGRNLYLKKNDTRNYKLFVVYDLVYSVFRLFNRNYTFKENLHFFKESFKSY